jgi:hypothetical protein
LLALCGRAFGGGPAPHGYEAAVALSRVGVSRHWAAAMWPGGVTWRRGGRGCWITRGCGGLVGDDNERADRMLAGLSRCDRDRGPSAVLRLA